MHSLVGVHRREPEYYFKVIDGAREETRRRGADAHDGTQPLASTGVAPLA